MSWMQKLYDTYNECTAWVGQYPTDGKRPLAPICHITKDAHVEIVLDGVGNIQHAQPITDKSDVTIIIPVTEDSAGKVGAKPVPHPFVDEIRYLAGDYVECGGKLPKGYEKGDPKQPYYDYRKLLSDWCNSAFAHPKAQAVLKYIERGTLVKDLARYGIFYLGSDGKFLSKKEVARNKDTQDIFAVSGMTNQEDAVIRWKVEIDDGTEMRTWRDESLWQSWIDYYLNILLSARKAESGAFCYVTGEETILTNKHPKYIRKKGDNPKLISSDDKKGFTFRGRFESADEACLIGLETSQKAHNALAWLIDRQGTIFWEEDGSKKAAGLTVLAWEASAQKEIPQPTQDTVGIGLYDDLPEDELYSPTAGQEYATRLQKKMLGYKAALEHTKWIYIIALDSLSQGRMAITYYQEFQPEIYLEKIETWHRECVWTHHYLLQKSDDVKNKPHKPKSFTGAPAPLDIAEVVHGKKASAKIKHHTVARLFSCIIEGRPLPRDIVDVAIRQASKRMGLYNPDDKKIGDEEYTWRKSLTIACALFRRYTLENTKEDYPMTLDPARTKRDYLYGRLLAIADLLEARALKDEEGKQKRPTNAARYMQQFSQHPFRTWKQIHDALNPYILRLGGKATWYKDQIAEVCCLFAPDEFKSDDPLTGEYLLGYYCQWQELRKFKKDALSTDGDEIGEDFEEESEDEDNEYDDDEEVSKD